MGVRVGGRAGARAQAQALAAARAHFARRGPPSPAASAVVDGRWKPGVVRLRASVCTGWVGGGVCDMKSCTFVGLLFSPRLLCARVERESMSSRMEDSSSSGGGGYSSGSGSGGGYRGASSGGGGSGSSDSLRVGGGKLAPSVGPLTANALASQPMCTTSIALTNASTLLKAHEAALHSVCVALGVVSSSSDPAVVSAAAVARVGALAAELGALGAALVSLGVVGGVGGVEDRVAAIRRLDDGANAGALGGGAAPAPSLALEYLALSEAIGAELAASEAQCSEASEASESE